MIDQFPGNESGEFDSRLENAIQAILSEPLPEDAIGRIKARAIKLDTGFSSDAAEQVIVSDVSSESCSTNDNKRKSLWKRSGALLAIVVLAALMVWFQQPEDISEVAENNWWLGSPSVYAGEIVEALRKGQVEGVVFRSSNVHVLEDGTEEKMPKVSTVVVIDDRYRYESTTQGRLNSVVWSVPDPDQDEFVVTKYLAHNNTANVRRLPREAGLGSSPISPLLKISELIEESSQKLGRKDIDGHQCVGFEIEASKVHKKHQDGTYQIWIDTKTKLPVKMIFDREWKMRDQSNTKRSITTMDQFEWNPKLSNDVFEPRDNPKPLQW